MSAENIDMTYIHHRGHTKARSCHSQGAIIQLKVMYIFSRAYHLRIFNIFPVREVGSQIQARSLIQAGGFY